MTRETHVDILDKHADLNKKADKANFSENPNSLLCVAKDDIVSKPISAAKLIALLHDHKSNTSDSH